jgi:predicted alpha/beta hydrolase family esterase
MHPRPAGQSWIERVVASQPVRATYASLVAHALALLLLAMLVSRPRAACGHAGATTIASAKLHVARQTHPISMGTMAGWVAVAGAVRP